MERFYRHVQGFGDDTSVVVASRNGIFARSISGRIVSLPHYDMECIQKYVDMGLWIETDRNGNPIKKGK